MNTGSLAVPGILVAPMLVGRERNGRPEGPGLLGDDMFQRIRQYNLVDDVSGRWYRPRAYGDPQVDGTWDGWLVFFPLGGSSVVATDRETSQTTFEALTIWSAGITPVYLEGALARALALAHRPRIIARLDAAEYEALEDAERLETAAEIERVAADVDEMAAAEARADAEQIRRERLATLGALAAREEESATRAAEIYENTARQARTVAAAAARRSRPAPGHTTLATRPTNRRSAKKK
jgi:hypothetical protein